MGFLQTKNYPGKRIFFNVLIDVSGSMRVYCKDITHFLNNFVKELKAQNAYKGAQISVLKFNTEVTELLPYTPLKELETIEEISGLKGGTDIGKALLHGIEHSQKEIEKAQQEHKGYDAPFVLLITDGVSNAGWGAKPKEQEEVAANYDKACAKAKQLHRDEDWLFSVMRLENVSDEDCDEEKELEELKRITTHVVNYEKGQPMDLQVKRVFDIFKNIIITKTESSQRVNPAATPIPDVMYDY